MNDNETKAIEKKKLKGWQIAVIVMSVIVIVLGSIGLGIYFGIFYGKGGGIVIEPSEISGFNRIKSYLGVQTLYDSSLSHNIDLKKMFSGEAFQTAVFTIEEGDNLARIKDNILITSGELGVVKIKAEAEGNSNTFDYEIVNGINVLNFNDLVNATQKKEAVILQRNIESTKITECPDATEETLANNGLALYNHIYGNAYKIDGTNYLKDEVVDVWDCLFDVRGKDIRIINVHLLGVRVEKPEGENIVLDDYADGGTLVKFEAISREDFPTGSVENSVLEKAHKIVYIHGADVKIEGNVIREAGDACVSIQTSNIRTSNIVMKDNVLINPQVAGVLFWLWDKQDIEPSNYVNLMIEGILDVYNWKNETTAALMPASENMAGLINPIIQATIAGSEFDNELIVQSGHKWIHVGIVVISTGKSKNMPNITGYDTVEYSNRKFPLPSALQPIVGAILKTTDMYGYTTIDQINPETDFTVTSEMFDKIWHR